MLNRKIDKDKLRLNHPLLPDVNRCWFWLQCFFVLNAGFLLYRHLLVSTLIPILFRGLNWYPKHHFWVIMGSLNKFRITEWLTQGKRGRGGDVATGGMPNRRWRVSPVQIKMTLIKPLFAAWFCNGEWIWSVSLNNDQANRAGDCNDYGSWKLIAHELLSSTVADPVGLRAVKNCIPHVWSIRQIPMEFLDLFLFLSSGRFCNFIYDWHKWLPIWNIDEKPVSCNNYKLNNIIFKNDYYKLHIAFTAPFGWLRYNLLSNKYTLWLNVCSFKLH